MNSGSWHCHHENLCERDTEPRETRIAYIKDYKCESEQALRLRLYQPMSAEGCRLLALAALTMAEAHELRDAARYEADKVRDAARYEADKVRDAAWVEANKVCDAARVEAAKVRDAAWVEANKVCDAAMVEAMAPLEVLHAIECPDCPWDGKTIFPAA